jgi:uncharacterized protein YbcI
VASPPGDIPEPHPAPPEALTEPDWSRQTDIERGGGMLAAISNAMVGLKKQFFGKGPEKARTYINDNYVFCVLQNVLTRNEETMLEVGEEDLIRTYRLRFQEAMRETTMGAVAEITGRRVIGYHSQIVFNPAISFEIFVLDAPPDGSSENRA